MQIFVLRNGVWRPSSSLDDINNKKQFSRPLKMQIPTYAEKNLWEGGRGKVYTLCPSVDGFHPYSVCIYVGWRLSPLSTPTVSLITITDCQHLPNPNPLSTIKSLHWLLSCWSHLVVTEFPSGRPISTLGTTYENLWFYEFVCVGKCVCVCLCVWMLHFRGSFHSRPHNLLILDVAHIFVKLLNIIWAKPHWEKEVEVHNLWGGF